MIEIINLRKRLGEREILKGVNLRVEKGEVVAILGPSGSGKSTLLRCINRLTDFDEGDILLDGVSVRDYDPLELRRKVGIVFQIPVMFEGSVYENISLGLKIFEKRKRRKTEEHVAREVERLAERVGVGECLSRDASKLSVGEQQRVAIARALILKPRVMLLDEPTSALDARNEENIENLILKLARSKSITVLWVTHKTAQAKRVGDRIAIMKNGKVVLVNNPDEIGREVNACCKPFK